MVVFGKLFRFSLAHGPVKAKNERTFQLGSGLAITASRRFVARAGNLKPASQKHATPGLPEKAEANYLDLFRFNASSGNGLRLSLVSLGLRQRYRRDTIGPTTTPRERPVEGGTAVWDDDDYITRLEINLGVSLGGYVHVVTYEYNHGTTICPTTRFTDANTAIDSASCRGLTRGTR